MTSIADRDPLPAILCAIQDRRVGRALEDLESLVEESKVDRSRPLIAVESLYALEDGMTHDQQDRLFHLERRLRAGDPARP